MYHRLLLLSFQTMQPNRVRRLRAKASQTAFRARSSPAAGLAQRNQRELLRYR